MDELLRQAKYYLIAMWKYRWPALGVAWLVALVGVVAVFRIPDRYEASARIYVDTQSILKPLMAGLTVQPNVEQQISMLSRTLLSRPNLEKLIRMADVDLKAESKAAQDALIDSLGKGIEIRNTGRDNLYSLAYRDSEPEKAKRVIQSLVSIFVESSMGASRKDSDQAKAFLEEQIKQYEARLEEAEAKVKAFKLRNLDTQTIDGKDSAGRLAETHAQLQSAVLQLREAENARDAARQQLAQASGQGGSLATQSLLQESSINVSTPELDSRIEALRRNLDALLQRFTEAHPDIVQGRRLLRDLEEQKKKEMADLRKAALASGAGLPANPSANLAQQELGRMVAAAEVQVASLKARVAEYSSRLAQAREALKTAPALEVEAAQLNRDYDVIKKNYESLVSRKQAAVMSGELDVASGVADFRLIDPPRVSPRPVYPNRMMLLPLPLLAGLAAGLFVAFAASQLRPTFLNLHDLRTRTGLPVLGVVSLVMDEPRRRRERMSMMRFASASMGLVGLFAVGLAFLALMSRGGLP